MARNDRNKKEHRNEQQGRNAKNPVGVQQYLNGIDYPATREELVEHAREQGAPREVIDSLQGLRGQRFNDPTEVSRSAGMQA